MRFGAGNRGNLPPGGSIYTIKAAVAENFWLPEGDYCLTKTKAMAKNSPWPVFVLSIIGPGEPKKIRHSRLDGVNRPSGREVA